MQTMKLTATWTRCSLSIMAVVALLSGEFGNAGDLLGMLGHRSDCGCGHSAGPVVHLAPAAPVMYQAPVVHVAPVVENACACSSAVTACCGIGGGMMQLGSLYGSGFGYSYGAMSHHSPAPGSFLSGYEGIPNMDGGGIHHRYPYHSYRRPWAHPGTPSTNVTIVW